MANENWSTQMTHDRFNRDEKEAYVIGVDNHERHVIYRRGADSEGRLNDAVARRKATSPEAERRKEQIRAIELNGY